MRKRTPLYLNSLEAAQKKGREEVDKYLASYKANVRCAEDIKRTIYYYYDGFRLPDGVENRVLDTYGLERMSYRIKIGNRALLMAKPFFIAKEENICQHGRNLRLFLCQLFCS